MAPPWKGEAAARLKFLRLKADSFREDLFCVHRHLNRFRCIAAALIKSHENSIIRAFHGFFNKGALTFALLKWRCVGFTKASLNKLLSADGWRSFFKAV